MIKRNFVDRSKDTILALYKSLVRLHLEYCCPIWAPHYNKDIKLNGVQRRATKIVQGIGHLSYDERLEYLGLTRLARRRIRGDLIETYKILNGVYSVPRDTFFQFELLGLRDHNCKLFKKRFRVDVKKFCFSNRVVDNWNCLSACCVSSNTINMFRIRKL